MLVTAARYQEIQCGWDKSLRILSGYYRTDLVGLLNVEDVEARLPPTAKAEHKLYGVCQVAERKVSPAMKKSLEENVRPFMRPMLFAFSCSEITMDDL